MDKELQYGMGYTVVAMVYLFSFLFWDSGGPNAVYQAVFGFIFGICAMIFLIGLLT